LLLRSHLAAAATPAPAFARRSAAGGTALSSRTAARSSETASRLLGRAGVALGDVAHQLNRADPAIEAVLQDFVGARRQRAETVCDRANLYAAEVRVGLGGHQRGSCA